MRPRGKTRTFKPRKDVPEGTKQYQLRKYAEATLVSPAATSKGRAAYDGRCRAPGTFAWRCSCPRARTRASGSPCTVRARSPACTPPIGSRRAPAVDFFNHLNMLYGTVTEFCTPEEVRPRPRPHACALLTGQCPIMSAGPRYEYLWEDGVRYKRPTKLPAPEYVDALMNWTQGLLDDQAVFPNKIGVPFPRGFRDTIRTIFRRLFRVYAHLYSNHFDHVCALGIEGASGCSEACARS
jgi:MOB kinase activator 1